jgi:hypothetical protein
VVGHLQTLGARARIPTRVDGYASIILCPFGKSGAPVALSDAAQTDDSVLAQPLRTTARIEITMVKIAKGSTGAALWWVRIIVTQYKNIE